MSQTAAHLVDHVIPHVPVRQWVLSLPIPLRLLLAAQPELVTPVLQEVQRVVTRHLLGAAGLKAEEGHGGAVTLIQRFGSAAKLNTHLHCLVLDGVYRSGADGTPAFIEADAPTDNELHALLQTVIARLMQMLTRRAEGADAARRNTARGPGPPAAVRRHRREQRSMPRCRWKRTTASGWSSCAATSPAPRCRTNGCSSTSPGRWS
jgi:hypothetical protein